MKSPQQYIVCFVDYPHCSNNIVLQLSKYHSAIKHRLQFVSKVLVEFILKLKQFHAISSGDAITLVGYCLGGQLASKFGREIAPHIGLARKLLGN